MQNSIGGANSGPWDPWLPVVENSRLFAQRRHSARCAPRDVTQQTAGSPPVACTSQGYQGKGEAVVARGQGLGAPHSAPLKMREIKYGLTHVIIRERCGGLQYFGVKALRCFLCSGTAFNTPFGTRCQAHCTSKRPLLSAVRPRKRPTYSDTCPIGPQRARDCAICKRPHAGVVVTQVPGCRLTGAPDCL